MCVCVCIIGQSSFLIKNFISTLSSEKKADHWLNQIIFDFIAWKSVFFSGSRSNWFFFTINDNDKIGVMMKFLVVEKNFLDRPLQFGFETWKNLIWSNFTFFFLIDWIEIDPSKRILQKIKISMLCLFYYYYYYSFQNCKSITDWKHHLIVPDSFTYSLHQF